MGKIFGAGSDRLALKRFHLMRNSIISAQEREEKIEHALRSKITRESAMNGIEAIKSVTANKFQCRYCKKNPKDSLMFLAVFSGNSVGLVCKDCMKSYVL